MQLAIPYFKTDPCKLLVDLFQAYYDARKNKRNTINALNFERHLESSLFALYNEIIEGRYEPQPSICFIVDRPVKREIFAADFRDRVVHHLIYNYISPIFENSFINDSYSCRKNKGTHYGIKRMDHFIRSCSQNYRKDCYILKLDISGYFMAINKPLLFKKVKSELIKNVGKIEFDHFVKKDLQIRYYGRYVDDFILIHQDKAYLKSAIEPIREFLDYNLQLKLHPDKIYMQHFTKGVKYLGSVIKPHRIYIARRTKGNFFEAIEKQNEIVRYRKPGKEELKHFLCSMNSYMGIMKHYKTYKARRKMIFKHLSGSWWNQVYLSDSVKKFVLKRKVCFGS